MAKAIVFDLNGTLLDMSRLDPLFARLFGDAGVREEWFHTLERRWLVSLVTKANKSFSKLAEAALVMTGRRLGVHVSAADRTALLENMQKLPPYPDVDAGLRMLRGADWRVAALTNGSLSSARAQLRYAKLDEHFERIMSAEQVRRLKPAREPYEMAAERLEIETREMQMVAAHWWDIAGARAAGCRTAFIARPGKVLDPLAPDPDITGHDLVEVARKMIRQNR